MITQGQGKHVTIVEAFVSSCYSVSERDTCTDVDVNIVCCRSLFHSTALIRFVTN